METPDIRYARSGDVSIAYQVVGNGPVDLLFVPFLINLVWAWEQPIFVDFGNRIKAFARLILFDKRGTGLSDRPRDLPTLETRMDDIRAVMDDAGSERAALLGAGSPGGQLSALFAATYPERVVALILQNTWPRVVEAPDFPAGDPVEEWHRRVRETRLRWGDREYQRNELRRYFPTRADDPEFEQWHVMHERLAASPGSAAWFMRVLMETDIREVLPTISVPTMILAQSRGGSRVAPTWRSASRTRSSSSSPPQTSASTEMTRSPPRWSASSPRATSTPRPSASSPPCSSRTSSTRPRAPRTWATPPGASCSRRTTRPCGHSSPATAATLIRSTGDGFCATFDGPARAIACAHAARRAVRDLGLDIRAGIHTGEVEIVRGRVEGIAVHIGARIAAEARPREVLVPEHRPRSSRAAPESSSRSAASMS